jgi:tRNA G18 (ribose-2'-O)-methylase SpoU
MTKNVARVGCGFLAIGIYHPKTEANIGSLWRSANLYGASFIFTVGRRYVRQSSDTMATHRHIPLIHCGTMDDLNGMLPSSCPLIGVEMSEDAEPLSGFVHPLRGAYLLGAEDHGLPAAVIKACHQLVQIECPKPWSMNVACAGSVLLWHRYASALAAEG